MSPPPSGGTAMYTQCPKCQTVFHVTLEQLKARAGLVRCGQCTHVFQADQQLYSDMPGSDTSESETPAEAPKKSDKGASKSAVKKPRESAVKTSPAAVIKKTPTAERATRRPARTAKPIPTTPAVEEVSAAPAPWSPMAEEPRAPNVEKPAAKPRRAPPQPITHTYPADSWRTNSVVTRSASFLWIAGSVLLVFSLATQAAYFYRNELVAYPPLRPFVLNACAQLGCVLHPSSDVNRIELVEPTGIAPHPRIGNALRLRATMVNRASRPQPYPLMEVTLTDRAGRVLSRRAFVPREYLEPSATEAEMLPNLAVSALLDVTNPDGKAVGYQIDFVAPPVQ